MHHVIVISFQISKFLNHEDYPHSSVTPGQIALESTFSQIAANLNLEAVEERDERRGKSRL